jgi:3-oxoacyl-[acyl-carrier protein] reductase
MSAVWHHWKPRRRYLIKGSGMSRKLEGRVAIVTGASRGIGEAIAIELAANGATVVACSTKAEGSLATVKQIEDMGGKAKAFGVDVADSAKVDEVVKATIAEFGRVDILVNNAGITRDGLLMRMTDEDWDNVLAVNLKGTFNFTRAVSRPMMKNKATESIPAGGTIINITSVVGITGNAGQANYTASKGGVIAFTKTVAKELGSRFVRCNAIAPGFIETKMTDALPEEVKQKYLETIPLKKFGKPSDIAKAVLWLASDDSSYVTGQIISVNGGMVG